MKAKVWVSLDRPVFQEGENVAGRVNVDSQEYIQAEEVRVESRVLEHYRELVTVRRGDQTTQEWQDRTGELFKRFVRVSAPSDFGMGLRTFPFEVNIPPYRPTRTGGTIEYNLKGVVAVKGRPDNVGETNVSFAPAVAPAPVAPTPIPMPLTIPPSTPAPAAGQPPAWPYAVPPAPAPAPPPVQVTQVITREVVKVRCRSCNTLMDVTSERCPNCGAPQ